MELELHFEDLSDDVVDAVASVQVQDLAVAGTPHRASSAADVGPFAVSSEDPTVRIDVDVDVLGGSAAAEPGLVVRVRARTADGTTQQFLNTTATRLRPDGAGGVRVPLQRIT